MYISLLVFISPVWSIILLYHSVEYVNGSIDLNNVCVRQIENVYCELNIPWLYISNVELKNHSIVNENNIQIALTLKDLYETSIFSSVYNNSVWYGEKFSCRNWPDYTSYARKR
jgi:hypothetical protein